MITAITSIIWNVTMIIAMSLVTVAVAWIFLMLLALFEKQVIQWRTEMEVQLHYDYGVELSDGEVVNILEQKKSESLLFQHIEQLLLNHKNVLCK